MLQSSTLPSRGCALSTAFMIALASTLAWTAGRTSSSRPHGNWDVPSADVAASVHPLRSVGERSDDNARAHHAGLAAEIAAADLKEVPEVLYTDHKPMNAVAVRLACISGFLMSSNCSGSHRRRACCVHGAQSRC